MPGPINDENGRLIDAVRKEHREMGKIVISSSWRADCNYTATSFTQKVSGEMHTVVVATVFPFVAKPVGVKMQPVYYLNQMCPFLIKESLWSKTLYCPNFVYTYTIKKVVYWSKKTKTKILF